jgi:hypothetical protein
LRSFTKKTISGSLSVPRLGPRARGHDIDEAVENLREATGLFLEEFTGLNVGRSLVTTFFA